MYEATNRITLNYGLWASICGPWMSVMATTEERSNNEDWIHGDGYLIHEVGHTIDPVSCGGITDAEWWNAVADDDHVYITSYARSSRYEDVAEMTWAWMISRCVPHRFHPAYKKYIDLYVGNRLTLLDREWLQKDWGPIFLQGVRPMNSADLDGNPWSCPGYDGHLSLWANQGGVSWREAEGGIRPSTRSRLSSL